MAPVLTPAQAVALLQVLSSDLRAAAVLGTDGVALAGDAGLAARVPALLAGQATGSVVRAVAPRGGTLLAVRSGPVAVAAETGPRALAALVAHDLAAALVLLIGPAGGLGADSVAPPSPPSAEDTS